MATFEITIDEEQIEAISQGDGVAAILRPLLNQILEAEMTEHVGAEPHERSDQRTGRRNGHYPRGLTTRVGTFDLTVPRDRDGTFSTALFERYQRSEKALTLALMEMVVNGVSTRKVSNITEELCGKEFKKSTVSDLCKDLNEQVEAFNDRPLDGQEYPFIIVDAMRIKVRRQRAVRSTSALIVVGINEEGYREILGLQIADSESKQSWLEMFRWLKQRGLTGVEFVTSDAHEGLVDALQQCFQGSTWQRCQTHFRRNVVDKTPTSLEDTIHQGLDDIFKADSPEMARTAFNELAADLEGKADRALETLELGLEDATAVLCLPEKYRRRLRTTNMVERLNSEVRRREKVVRIFPNDESAWRLIGAYLAERHEEWSTKRRYLKMDEFHRWKRNMTDTEDDYPMAAE
jgi:transposase-like protein